jgi:hypothetical protein
MKILRLGAFILLAFGVATVQATTDVGAYYWVLKRADYMQTSTANPVPAGAPFHFNSLVTRSATGNFTQSISGFVPPGSGIITTPQHYDVLPDGSLNFDSYVSSQANLDAAWGPGGYNLDIRGAMREWFPTLHLNGASSFPPEKPKLSNSPFNNGDLIVNRANPLTLQWNSFASHDFVDDVIILTITRGTAIILREVLPSSTTSRAFPANFFDAEQVYTVEISFVKVVDRNTASIPGSVGLAGFASTTRIFISTSTRTPVNGLYNISTRGLVGTGANVLISGFIITSTDTVPLRIIIRAIGPSLAASHIANPLQDPILTLFDSNNHVIASNDNWRNTAFPGQITAAGLNPRDDRESALFQNLAPGSYTAIVQGKNNATGTALTEVYNLSSSGQAKLANISTRGQVLTGDNVLIGGFFIQGPFNHTMLIKGLGPSLAAFNVPNVLPNPTLQLTDAQGNTLAINDDWQASQAAQILATGRQPANNKESAILRPMGPGAYTAIVRSKNSNTGIGLVSVDVIN